MNNITLILLISFTKALSFIPKSIFTNKNSPLWSLLSKLLKKRKKIIEANINHCYQDKTPEWRNDLVEKIWGETFLALYENNFAWNADKRINKYKCEVQNGELLADAQKQNTGVLLLFRHSIFLELSARLISERFEIYGMERPNNNPAIQSLQQKGRLKSMKGLTANSNINQLINWLKEGKTVLYGPDQDYRNKRSVVSKFFSKPCLTTTVPYNLRRITNCKLIYLDFYKTSDGYKFILEDVSHSAENKQAFADNINKIIERSVNQAPEHYLWHHRRFKSQAPEIYD
jgi:KDO2-lipid IV(A) lauroyltransferase